MDGRQTISKGGTQSDFELDSQLKLKQPRSKEAEHPSHAFMRVSFLVRVFDCDYMMVTSVDTQDHFIV